MRKPPALLWALASLLAVYLVAPFVAGAVKLGAADWAGADVHGLLAAAGVSVLSATIATVLIALGGIPLGYVLARVPSRALGVLGFVVQLPLALPPLASGVLLLFLLGYASPLGRLTHGALTDSFIGIVLAEAFVAAPFLIIAARSAFSSVDPALEDVAATLGHGPWAVFRKVSLALSWRTLLAGLLLAWLRAFGEFGATVMVAYHPYSLPVFTYVAFGSSGLPAMLPVLLPTVLAAVLVMALSQATLSVAGRKTAPHDPPHPLIPADKPAAQPDGAQLHIEGRRRLDDFTLDVAWTTGAKRLAILGASGSGKSMTLRLIAGLDAAAGSRIGFGAQDLAALPAQARGVAYVPQSYGLPPHLTVARQVRFAADCDPALARHWTERLGLADLQQRRPAELSLGQQQRVALARALSRPNARLVLLDEPFSALDTPLRARLRQELMMLQDEVDATTILVTHDPAEAMLLADELLLLEAGRVLQAGPVGEVFARPVSEAAARLLGAEVIGWGRVTRDGRIDIGGGVLLIAAGPALSANVAVGWSVRPFQVRLGEAGAYPATLLSQAPVRDGQRRVTLKLGDVELSLLTDPSCPALGRCRVDIDPQALQVWPVAWA
ncbi:MAG: ABC transporter ATP-binding protein/permease [Caulobacteraceae bacterium]